MVLYWFCSIFGSFFKKSCVSLGEGNKYHRMLDELRKCLLVPLLVAKGQGVAGLTHLARHALDVLSRMERHDDASVKYLQRLRSLGYRNSGLVERSKNVDWKRTHFWGSYAILSYEVISYHLVMTNVAMERSTHF